MVRQPIRDVLSNVMGALLKCKSLSTWVVPSNLRYTAVDEQFNTYDKTTVIRSEEGDSSRDFVGTSNSLHWYNALHLRELTLTGGGNGNIPLGDTWSHELPSTGTILPKHTSPQLKPNVIVDLAFPYKLYLPSINGFTWTV
jgi:hypothetical protein